MNIALSYCAPACGYIQVLDGCGRINSTKTQWAAIQAGTLQDIAIREVVWQLYLFKFARDHLRGYFRQYGGLRIQFLRHGKRSRGTMTMAAIIVVATGPARRSRCCQFSPAFFASPDAFNAAGFWVSSSGA